MRDFLGVCVLFIIPALLFSCAGYQSVAQPAADLDLSWQRGDTWAVGVKFYPQRLSDPRILSDSSVYKKWNYKVVEADPESGYLIRQYCGSDTYLLSFSPRYELLEVRRLLQKLPAANKYQTEKTNQLAGGGFFYLPGSSHPPLIWYHPAVFEFKREKKRFNFNLRSSRSGDWLLQYATPASEGYKITLLHEPSETNIYFFWNLDKPWWNKVIWRSHKRVVATAELL